MAKLIFRSGPYAGKSVSLPIGKAIVIGRNRDIDLPLPDLKLSRRHCQITVHGDGNVVVQDLNSTNGTFLNGGRILDEMPVNPFDRIVIGDTEMELQSTERNDEFLAPAVSSESSTQTRQQASPAGQPVVGSTVQQAKPTPFELAVREMMLPLPPEPPPLVIEPPPEPAIIEPPRLTFCDLCNSSIPLSDWQLGNAKEFEGKNVCKDCLSKGVVVGPPVPKHNAGSSGRNKTVDDMIAGLNDEAVMVDTTLKRRGVAVADAQVAESMSNFQKSTSQTGVKMVSGRQQPVGGSPGSGILPTAPAGVTSGARLAPQPAKTAPAMAKAAAKPPSPSLPATPAAQSPSSSGAELGDEFEEIG